MTNPLQQQPKDQYEKWDLEYNIPVFMATYGLKLEDIRKGIEDEEEDRYVLTKQPEIKIGVSNGKIIGINQNEHGTFYATILTKDSKGSHLWNSINLSTLTPHWANCFAHTQEKYKGLALNLENTIKEIQQSK